MLPPDHPAIVLVKNILLRLPKFNINSSVPYNMFEIKNLHKCNINLVINYLYRHGLPIPFNLENTIYTPDINVVSENLQIDATSLLYNILLFITQVEECFEHL